MPLGVVAGPVGVPVVPGGHVGGVTVQPSGIAPGLVAGAVGVPVEPGGHVVGVSHADGEVPGVPGAPGIPCVPGVSVGPQTGGGVVQPGEFCGDCEMPGTAFSWPHGPSGDTRSWVPSSPEDGDGLVLVLGVCVDGVSVDGVGADGGCELVSVLGVVVGVGLGAGVGGVGAGAGGVLVSGCGAGAGAGVGAGAGGVVCAGGAGVVVSGVGCSLVPGVGDCGGVDGVVVDGLGCSVCVVSFHPEFSSWANELAAPAVRSQTNVNAIAMPSRSSALLTGAGLTWDRNRVLLPSR
jgi:hypothetical protein